jgi:hypothetical protein
MKKDYGQHSNIPAQNTNKYGAPFNTKGKYSKTSG